METKEWKIGRYSHNLPINIVPGTEEFAKIAEDILAHEKKQSELGQIEAQQSEHMGKPQVLDLPRIESKRVVRTGAGPVLMPLDITDQKAFQEKNRVEGLHQQALDTHPLKAYSVLANKAGHQLYTGVKNILPDFIGGDEEENIRRHEEGFEATSYLESLYPGVSVAAKMSPYMIPYEQLIGAGVKAAGTIPKIRRGTQALKNFATPLNTLETSLKTPGIRNAIEGAVIGGIDPYDTAIGGGVSSYIGSKTIGSALERLAKPMDFRNSSQVKILDKARKLGFHHGSGVEFGDEALQATQNAAGRFEDTMGIKQMVTHENNVTSKRVILQDIFGLKGDDLGSSNLERLESKISKEMDDSVKGFSANGSMILNSLDEADNMARRMSTAITDDAALAKYNNIVDEIDYVVGGKTGRLDGKGLQHIDRILRDNISDAKIKNPELYRILVKIRDDIDDSVMNHMGVTQGQEALDAFKAAKQKYAVGSMVLRHTDAGELNYGGLHEEMRAFNPQKWSLHNPNSNTPIDTLQTLVQYHKLNDQTLGSTLSITDKLGRQLTDETSSVVGNAPMGVKDRLGYQLRGQTLANRKNPIPFRAGIDTGGRIGSASSEQFPIATTDTAKTIFDYIGDKTESGRGTILDLLEKHIEKLQYRP